MQVIRDKRAMHAWSRTQHAAGHKVGLVPTMGNLHAGHLTLVDEARRHAEKVAVSIYVNPTQFAANEDLDKYPRTFEADTQKLEAHGVDAVFFPKTLYVEETPKHETWVRVTALTKTLCGRSRPEHFRGVTTIVAKLFNIMEPDVAVFGDKDYQQRRVIDRMVRDLDFAVQVIAMPIARDADGLALSSRNSRILPENRQAALSLSRGIRWAALAVADGERDAATIVHTVRTMLNDAGAVIDYVELMSDATLTPLVTVDQPGVLAVAAFVGEVRLIDNVRLAAT